MVQTGHVCYILDSSGFRAYEAPSNMLLMVSEAAKFCVNASLPLVMPAKKKDFEEDGWSHNAKGKNQRQKQNSHW